MKKNLKLFSLLVLILLQTPVFAQRHNYNSPKTKYEFVKNKAFSKSYSVSSSEKLNITNSFGSVEVKTWDKNEFKVDVAIEVSATSEALAQKLIDAISINDKQGGGEVTCVTSINESDTTKGGKSNMTINYTVYMPASNPLNLQNEFGAIVIPDFKGELNVSSKFGSLTTGALPNPKNNISVEFSNAKFESISNAGVDIKYSQAEFGKLAGNIKMNLAFCNPIKINIDNNLGSLDLRASYSTVNIKPSTDLSASYDITTSYGSFKNRAGIQLEGDDNTNDKYPKFNHHYTGKSGSGAIPVKVSSSFGKIILGDATPEEMKESRSKSLKP